MFQPFLNQRHPHPVCVCVLLWRCPFFVFPALFLLSEKRHLLNQDKHLTIDIRDLSSPKKTLPLSPPPRLFPDGGCVTFPTDDRRILTPPSTGMRVLPLHEYTYFMRPLLEAISRLYAFEKVWVPGRTTFPFAPPASDFAEAPCSPFQPCKGSLSFFRFRFTVAFRI